MSRYTLFPHMNKIDQYEAELKAMIDASIADVERVYEGAEMLGLNDSELQTALRELRTDVLTRQMMLRIEYGMEG